jgi:Fe-S cluster assembly scaffold protein SufB
MDRTHSYDQIITQHSFTEDNLVIPANTSVLLIATSSEDDCSGKTLKHRITVEENATVRLITTLFHSADIEVTGELKGNGSRFEHMVIYFGNEKQQMRLRTHTLHLGADTTSHVVVHGVAIQQSQIDFAGVIDISPTGKGTNAHLEHEGLLLSRKARIDAIPGFEIHTNDVKATHSSAVHYIRPEQLFYLQTRGIDTSEAKKLIVGGFLNEMVAYIHEADSAQQLDQMIEERIALIN